MSEGTATPARHWSRHLWLLLPVLLAVASAKTQAGHPHDLAGGARRVTLFDAWVPTSLFSAALASCVALALAGRWRERAFPRARWSLAFLVSVVASPCMLMWAFVPPWYASDPVSGPDGRDYAEVRYAFMQAQGTGVARLAAEGFGWRTWEVLGIAGTDYPSVYGAVVRPDVPGEPQSVCFTRDGLAIGASRGEAYVAVSLDGSRMLTGEDALRLSPFVLLDASAPGRDSDVDSIVERLARVQSGPSNARARFLLVHPDESEHRDFDDSAAGLPTETSLLAALDHANPWVRAAARRIVEAGGADMYPAAMKRLGAK